MAKILSRDFSKLLYEYGLSEKVLKSGHIGICRHNKIIYRMAGTPKNRDQALDNSVKDLIKIGAIPMGIVFRGKKYTTKKLAKTLDLR